MDKKLLGAYGEALAEIYMMNHGYKILSKNYRCKCGEIDLVVKRNRCIHFIEVKTRSDNGIAEPRASVNLLKQRKIKECARIYLQNYDGFENVVFDVMEVKLNFFEDSFR